MVEPEIKLKTPTMRTHADNYQDSAAPWKSWEYCDLV